MIIDDMITTGHARALLAIDDQEQQYILANKIFDEKLKRKGNREADQGYQES